MGSEACGAAGLVPALPASPAPLRWPEKVRRRTRHSFPHNRQPRPVVTSPTKPHSRPRNFPPGVLWVTRGRHPFPAGPHPARTRRRGHQPQPARCLGTRTASLPPDPVTATPSPVRREEKRERRDCEGWRRAGFRGSDWTLLGTTEPPLRSRRSGGAAPAGLEPGLECARAAPSPRRPIGGDRKQRAPLHRRPSAGERGWEGLESRASPSLVGGLLAKSQTSQSLGAWVKRAGLSVMR